MANTTSGTATFGKTFAIDDIIEEAFERCGIRGVAGYQLKTARRSLNIMFQEWANRGIHLWEIADGYLTLVASTNQYIGYRASSDGTSTLLAIPTSTSATDLIEPYVPDNGILFKAGAYISLPSGVVDTVTVFYDG